jgi:hypothetical protein
MWASREGYPSVVRQLLEAGADADLKDEVRLALAVGVVLNLHAVCCA